MIRFKNIDIKVPLTMVLLALFYFFMLFYQAKQVAITDDARFYMSAAKSYSNYFENCNFSKKCFEQSVIDKYWSDNHEHPPFAKLLMAGGYFVFYKKFKMLDEIRALRIGVSIFAVILLMFIFSFTRRAFSFHAAVFSSLFFIFLPRTFFHARVATLDFAVAGTSFIFVYCYWRGFTSKFFAWMTGIAFGIALSTKLNAPFMVLPVLIHYFYVKRAEFKKRPVKILFAPQFVSMLLFSIPVFFMLWPWLWHVTIRRFGEYVAFHMNHYGILMYYLGNIYNTPRPPWHGPLVMMILTTPVMTLFFAAVSPMFYKWKEEKECFSPMLLVILSAVVSISALMFLPAPYYSGVKLFQPFFPFLAIIAGTGLYFVLKGVTIIPERYKFAPAVMMFIPVIFSMIDLKNDHLSYYNELAGGTKGASAYGNEQHYYDLFYYELTEFFNKECAKKVCRVSFEPNAKEYDPSSNILKKAGYLTNNFRFSNADKADYFVLTHEYRWRQYPFILRNSKKLEKIFTIEKQGVDLVTVFRLDTEK
ncbi:MAG TPA: glycosyltransferase family 39 protein [bacterium]|nr:glycosyltransferase family 39 protein [bacterium]